jgi:hypothetical protein
MPAGVIIIAAEISAADAAPTNLVRVLIVLLGESEGERRR